MKKKRSFIGVFIIVVAILLTTANSVQAKSPSQDTLLTDQLLTNSWLRTSVLHTNRLNTPSKVNTTEGVSNATLPTIDVKLGDTPTSGENNQVIDVTYTLKPEDFKEAVLGGGGAGEIVKEAVFVVDVSSNMNQNAFSNGVIDGFVNQFNYSDDIKKNGMKIGFIGYNSSVVYANNNESTAKLHDYSNPNEIEELRRLLQEGKLTVDWNNSKRDITDALKKSKNMLSSNTPNSQKAIVIVSTDKIEADHQVIKEIKAQGYRIISFYLGNTGTQVEQAYSLEELHHQLGGQKDHYIVTPFEGGNCNYASNDMAKVRDALLGKPISTPSDSYTIQPTLTFDLGEDFSAISGLESLDGTRYQLKVPEIAYKLNGEVYQADLKEVTVSFKILVDTKKTGVITFWKPDSVKSNYLSYQDANDQTVKVNIETPTYTIEEENKPPTMTDGTLHILEIEPADYFQLGSSAEKVTGHETVTVNKETVEITRMTMPEFIGKVETINGKYDVVVVGRLVRTDWGKDVKHQQKYQDYRFERNDEFEENDITNRKAQEIIDFIQSGQLVYLDAGMNDESIKATKLYRNFVPENQAFIEGANLVTNKAVKDLTLKEIVEAYQKMKASYKQNLIEVTNHTPSDVTTDDLEAADGKPEHRNRTLTVNLSTKDGTVESATVKLYLDVNGDGLFSDDEVAVTREDVILPVQDLALNYNVHPDFLGLLEWKLEITKDAGDVPIKTYLTGDMNFHRLPGQDKRLIRVLQISNNDNFKTADEEGNRGDKKYEVLDLSKNKRFQTLLKSKELKDYDFEIKIISAYTFNQIVSKQDNELSAEEQQIKELNGYYDMVILGFADNYGDKISQEGLDNIVDFLKTGQGLMLTHDTLTYGEGNVEQTTDKMLQTFRGIAGQGRYSNLYDLNGQLMPYDPDRIELNGNESNKDLKLLRYSGATWAATLNKIPNDEKDTQRGNKATLSTEVYETNSALITSYPFNLVEAGSSTLGIRRTHGQYLQLNLEDELVIPWYTYTEVNDPNAVGDDSIYQKENQVNPYDVRNNYYTYSRENVTFSGTGEQKRERNPYPDSELKLFVNTIIKSNRGANHAPTFDVKNLYNDMMVSREQETLNFDVIPSDMDLDDMRIEVEAYGCSSDQTCTLITDFNDPEGTYPRANGESSSISLDIKDKLTGYSSLKINIKVVDEHGAASAIGTYLLQLTNDNLLDIQLNSGGYLIGDTAKLTAQVKRLGTDAKNFNLTLGDIPSPLTLSGDSKINIEQLSEDKSFDYYFNVGDSPLITPSHITAVTVPATYRYQLGDQGSKIEGKREGTINLKRGQIQIDVSSSIANLSLDVVLLEVLDREEKEVARKTVTGTNQLVFDTVPSGTYQIKVIKPEGLAGNVTLHSDESLAWNEPSKPFTISYEENVKVFKVVIGEENFGLLHGILEDQTESELIIKEAPTKEQAKPVEGKTLVNFAATFTSQVNNDASLTVSKELQGINETSIRLYYVESVESDETSERIDETSKNNIKVKPLIGATVTLEDDNRYKLTLPSETPSGTKIFVQYTGLVPNKESLLTNRLAIGIEAMDVWIKVTPVQNIETDTYLPDLF